MPQRVRAMLFYSVEKKSARERYFQSQGCGKYGFGSDPPIIRIQIQPPPPPCATWSWLPSNITTKL